MMSTSTRLWRFRVDWDGDGSFSNANSDISVDVLSMRRASRGRNYEDQLYGKSEAGRLTLTLRNDDNKYDRFNQMSELSDLVVPGREVRFETREPGSTSHEVQWTGFVDDIKKLPRISGNDQVELRAFGILARLTQREISVAMQVNIAMPAAFGLALDAATVPVARRSTIEGSRTLARWWVATEPALRSLRALEDTELGFIKETKDGKVGFEGGQTRIEDMSAAVVTFTESRFPETGHVRVAKLTPRDPQKDIANRIDVPVRRFRIASSEVLWSVGQTFTLNGGESITITARYPSPNVRTGALGVDAWDAMMATTDYLANEQEDGGGADLTSNLTVTTVDTATSRKITLLNSGSTSAVITRLQTRGSALMEEAPTSIEYLDQASIDEYEPQDFLLSPQFISSIDDAISYGSYIISILKDPQTRATLVFEASEQMPLVHRIDLSTKVNLVIKEVVTEFFVEGIWHEIRRGLRHFVGLLLSPTGITGDVIVLDDGRQHLDEGILGR